MPSWDPTTRGAQVIAPLPHTGAPNRQKNGPASVRQCLKRTLADTHYLWATAPIWPSQTAHSLTSVRIMSHTIPDDMGWPWMDLGNGCTDPNGGCSATICANARARDATACRLPLEAIYVRLHIRSKDRAFVDSCDDREEENTS